jgi:hypothetical protein
MYRTHRNFAIAKIVLPMYLLVVIRICTSRRLGHWYGFAIISIQVDLMANILYLGRRAYDIQDTYGCKLKTS